MERLERVPLGSTGLLVSRLGLGGSTFGGVFGPMAQSDVTAVVREAARLGVNYVDTSPWYGDSEAKLGRALREVGRGDFVVATKVGRYYEGRRFDFSARETRASVLRSLELLGGDSLDLVQVHDCEFAPSLELVAGETLPELVRLRSEGKLRHIGITGLPLRMLRDLLDLCPPGVVQTVLSYCHNTLYDDSLVSSGFLQHCIDRGVAVINASPTGMGLLTPTELPEWHPAPKDLRVAAHRANEHFSSLPSLALAFSAHNPLISTTLVGCSSLEHLYSAHRALVDPYPEQDIERARSFFSHVQGRTWPSGKYK